MAETIEGLADLKAAFKDLANDLKRKVLRAALRDAAKPIQKAAVQAAPTLKSEHPYRLPGTLKKSIITKASKRFRGQDGEIGVYVAVRKRKGLGGKSSARNPFDPFYWRFQEFGTKNQPARPFLRQAFDRNTTQAVDIFSRQVLKRIEKANRRK
jgi:HK97 gp10 family phage protein